MKKFCIGKNLKKLWSCDRGAVAPLVGVCAIMLVGAVAVAVDVGRGQVAQSKLQAALDSAGLAAGAVVAQALDEDALKVEARKYLDVNFAGYTVDATIDPDGFDLDLSDNEQTVTLSATASLPTTFMRIFGHDTMQVAARTEITREMTGLEIVLVLDVTGSMCQPNCAKRDAMKTGALNLVAKMFDPANGNNVEDLWIGIVPFSQGVNIGTARTNWLANYNYYNDQIYCNGPTSGTPRCSSSDPYWTGNTANVSTRTNPITRVNRYMFSSRSGWYFSPHAWGGCVEAREAGGEDVTDTPPTGPSSVGFPVYFAPDTGSSGGNDWRNSSGGYQVTSSVSANKGCPPSPVTPLTNVKATLDTAINNLNVSGYTMLPVGAAWGWRMLSPEWRGLWGGDMDANNLPLAYDEPLMDKVVVFMTDGDNDMPADSTYVAYGTLANGRLGTTDEDDAEAELDNRFAQICNAMKAEGVGIRIYTISLGAGVSPHSKELLQNCASLEPYYFHAADGTELIQKFNEVADALSKLRVSK